MPVTLWGWIGERSGRWIALQDVESLAIGGHPIEANLVEDRR